MAGRGPAPKARRYRRAKPGRGEWAPSPDGAWQHDLPSAPSGVLPASERIWEGWFKAWWAAHWTPDDVPMLRFVLRLHDRVLRGDLKRLPELRQWLDTYGITPKGQQDRRWQRPEPPRPPSRLDRFRDTHRHAHPYITETPPRPRIEARDDV